MLSSATIRNVLADLEELGLVEQPHASAGRVPTDLGYRVYVNCLLKPEGLTEAEKEYIQGAILKEGRGINEILGQTCRVLGEITKQLGVTIAPRFEEGRFKRLELIPVAEGRIMVVVVVRSGLARSVIVEAETDIDESELRQVEQVLNERLAGLTLGEIRRTLAERLSDFQGQGRLIQILVDSSDQIWRDKAAGRIQVAGLDRLMIQPEFSSREKVTELVRLLENGDVLGQFLSEANEEGLVITIGKENKFVEIMNCSLVTSSYRVGRISGTIGIIGPTRMPYDRLASVVDYTARAITDVLSEYDEQ